MAARHLRAGRGVPRQPRPGVGGQRLQASSDNAYGSIYYLLTGFHGLHVLGGLVLMVLAAAVVVRRRPRRVPVGPTYTVTGYYWHFVDVVWIGVFVTIFLVQ